MRKYLAYAKAIVAVAGATVTAAEVALTDGVIVGPEWTTIIIAAVTAAGVYLTPNKPAE